MKVPLGGHFAFGMHFPPSLTKPGAHAQPGIHINKHGTIACLHVGSQPLHTLNTSFAPHFSNQYQKKTKQTNFLFSSDGNILGGHCFCEMHFPLDRTNPRLQAHPGIHILGHGTSNDSHVPSHPLHCLNSSFAPHFSA